MKRVILSLAMIGLIGGTAPVWAQDTLTDAKIVEIMKVANEGEVDLAKTAKSKAENKDVKEFAKKMIDDHKHGEKEAKEAAKKAKVKHEESAQSKDLEKTAKAKRDELKKLKGKDFDKAYMDQQIAMHQQLLDELNTKLIPSAQSPDVKTYLESMKTHVQEHLSRAQEIQTSLNR